MSDPNCPVCDGARTTRFVERRDVPVHQNLVMRTAAAAKAIARGDLMLHRCDACGFIFNAAFDAALLQFGGEYDNMQTHSPAFAAHAEAMAERIARHDVTILEIGCGQGDFLRRLMELASGCTAIGYDPSYKGPPNDNFRERFFDDSCDERADLVVCRHVIGHVVDPIALLRSVRRAVTPGGRVFFETLSAQWVLDQPVAWDFCYEQCSYFSERSLRLAFERAGMDVVAIEPVFGEQYLLIEATCPAEPNATRITHRVAAERERIAAWWDELDRLGRVALWGAAAKGATFAGLVDPDAVRIDCVVDINPGKQGCFLPGSGHPIVAPEALRDRDVAAVLVTNPNYHDEIVARLREMGVTLPVVDLMELNMVNRK